MRIEVSLPLEEALDLSWKTLAECFEPEELLMKQELIDRYYPKIERREEAGAEPGAAEESNATESTQNAATSPD
jgi:V/A-type H+-transporting ATPase subunit B